MKKGKQGKKRRESKEKKERSKYYLNDGKSEETNIRGDIISSGIKSGLAV